MVRLTILCCFVIHFFVNINSSPNKNEPVGFRDLFMRGDGNTVVESDTTSTSVNISPRGLRNSISPRYRPCHSGKCYGGAMFRLFHSKRNARSIRRHPRAIHGAPGGTDSNTTKYEDGNGDHWKYIKFGNNLGGQWELHHGPNSDDSDLDSNTTKLENGTSSRTLSPSGFNEFVIKSLQNWSRKNN